jgi:ADP-ribose pyrophosphatase
MNSRVLYRGPVFSVRRDSVVEPGNIKVVRDVVEHCGSVVLLPVFPDGRILLVRQYRHAVGRFLWELVAGRIEQGESPLAAARRELMEEAGYNASRYVQLLRFFPTPGFVSERMVLYRVEGLRRAQATPEADELIVSRKFSLPQLLRMIRRGTIADGKSIAGILFHAMSSKRGV